MPGTNHQLEKGFIDELDIHQRAVADEMLKLYSLKTLVDIRQQGPSETLRKQFAHINEFEWIDLIQKVLLAKISYFEPNDHFNLQELDKLLQIAKDSLGLSENADEQKIVQYTAQRYPIFSNVLQQILILRQKKLNSC